MKNRARTVVLSGFGVFGDYVSNPTEEVVRSLSGRIVSGFRIISKVFPGTVVMEDRGGELLDLARRKGAVGIISLGVASGRSGLCVESLAVNKIDNVRYCPPWVNNSPVCRTRRYKEALPLNLAPWNLLDFFQRCQDRGIPMMPVSTDAGRFCCNQLMYQLLLAQLQEERRRIPFIFMHVPCAPESVRDAEAFRQQGKFLLETGVVKEGLAILLENAWL